MDYFPGRSFDRCPAFSGGFRKLVGVETGPAQTSHAKKRNSDGAHEWPHGYPVPIVSNPLHRVSNSYDTRKLIQDTSHSEAAMREFAASKYSNFARGKGPKKTLNNYYQKRINKVIRTIVKKI